MSSLDPFSSRRVDVGNENLSKICHNTFKATNVIYKSHLMETFCLRLKSLIWRLEGVEVFWKVLNT